MFPPSHIWNASDPILNRTWVYDTIAAAYPHITGTALETFSRGGFYTITNPADLPGLRLIVLNTNFCYNNNFWLFYESEDVEDHLAWLVNELQLAEDEGDMVYLIGHIPPGKSDCWTIWSREFNRVVLRYEAIIKAQFYGHTHNDETAIFFDTSANPPRPMNTLNIGVSTTAYTNLNPGFKVYYADGADETTNPTYELMDHETWVYNLSLANEWDPTIRPSWYKLYNMKEAFGLQSLRPAHLYEMVTKMVNDNDLFQKYWRFYHKDSHLASACQDVECRMRMLCEIVTADSGDHSNCDRLKALLPGSSTVKPNNAPKSVFVSILSIFIASVVALILKN
jgi:sphingomyelin phosphodiesterase